MATVYPGSLDTFANPASSDPMSKGIGHAAQHDNINDAVAALEAKVGINSATNTNCIDYQISHLSSLSFSNANGVSFGIVGSTLTASAAGGGGGVALYDGANSITSGTARFTNANGVSFSINGQTISASVQTNYQSQGAYLTTAMQSNAATISNINVSAGAASANLSAVVFSNSNGISFGLNGSTVTGTVATNYQSQGAYLTTAALSQNTSNYAGINGAITGGSITVNTSGVSVNLPAYLTTADLSANSSKYVQAWEIDGNNTAGTTSSLQGTKLFLSGGNGVTLSGNSNTVVMSVATNYQSQGAYLTTADLSANSSNYLRQWSLAGNNTAGTISSLQGTQLNLSGGQGITLSGNSNTIVFSVGSYITTGMLSGASTQFVQSNAGFNGTNCSGTIASSGISVSVGAYLTTAALSSQTLAFTLSGNVATTNSSQILNSGYALAGGNGVTLQQSNNTVSISVATNYQSQGAYLTTAMQSNAATISNINISAGASSTNASAVTFSNVNGVTFGYDKTNITASINSTSAIGLNTAQTNVTWTVNSSGLSLNAGGYAGTASGATNCSVTANTSGVSVNVPQYINSFFEPVEWFGNASSASINGLGTLGLQPFFLNNYLSFNCLNMIVSAALSGTFGGSANTFTVSINGLSSHGFSATASITNSNNISVALFTRGGGSNTDMLYTISTTSFSLATAFINAITLSATGGAASWSATLSSKMSVSLSWPTMTSGQAINGASSWTTWAPGYTNSNSSTSGTNSTIAALVTTSFSLGSSFPGNLSSFWQSNKMLPIPFAGSLTPGDYWLGIWRMSSTSSTLSTANANVGANNSYTSSVNWSAGTSTGQLSWAGSTASIVSSLGWLGAASQATMVPSPGQGSFSATYATNSTYANAAGQPNGAVAFSNINSGVQIFRSWLQFAVNRI